jgi:hypothetical protein
MMIDTALSAPETPACWSARLRSACGSERGRRGEEERGGEEREVRERERERWARERADDGLLARQTAGGGGGGAPRRPSP